MKSWIWAIVFGIVAFIPVFAMWWAVQPEPKEQANFWFQFEAAPQLESGLEFQIKACKMLEVDCFQLYLEGGNWIEARLAESPKQEALSFVSELLQKTTPPSPSVILRVQSGQFWIVDVQLMVDGKRSNLLDVLRSKNLLK